MNDKTTSDDLLVRYLLGRLSEDEQSRVEKRFINDGEYYEQLLLTEDELRCAYATGSLPPAERELFEKRFLIFPDERERVELARAMMRELSSVAVEARSEPLTVRSDEMSWREKLLAGFRSSAARFAMAAAVVVLLVAVAWMAMETSRLRQQVSQLEATQDARGQEAKRQSNEDRSQVEQLSRELEDERNRRALLEHEIAQLHEQSSPDDTPRPAVISLMLAPGRIRAGGETRRITISDDSAQVRLLLNIGDSTAYGNYQAVLLNSDGAQVWSRRGLRASQKVVVITVPARLLSEDDYEINLKGLAQNGELERVGDYYFTVLKKRQK
jgi:hypothetical protein